MRLRASRAWPWLLVLTTGFEALWEAESLLVPGASVSVNLGAPSTFDVGSNRRTPGATRTRDFMSATHPSYSRGTSAASPTRPHGQGRFEVPLAFSQADRRPDGTANSCTRIGQFHFLKTASNKCRREFGMSSVWNTEPKCISAQNRCEMQHYIACCTRTKGTRKLDTYCKILKYLKREDKACDANQHIKKLSKVASEIKHVTNALAAAIWNKTTTGMPTTETLAISSTTGMPQQPRADSGITRIQVRYQVVSLASTAALAQAPPHGNPGVPVPSLATSMYVQAMPSNSDSGTKRQMMVVDPGLTTALPSGNPGAPDPSPATLTNVPAMPSPNSNASTTRSTLVIDPGPTRVPHSGNPRATATTLDTEIKSYCDTLRSLLADFHRKTLALDAFVDSASKDRRAFDDDLMDQMIPYVNSVKDFLARMQGICVGTQKHKPVSYEGKEGDYDEDCVDGKHQKINCKEAENDVTESSARAGNRRAQRGVGATVRVNVDSLNNASDAYAAFALGTYGPTRKVHPRGNKWWRYRWGYTFMESVLLLLCLIPSYPIRRVLRNMGLWAGAKVPGAGLRRVGKPEDMYQYPFFNCVLHATSLQLTYFFFQFLGEFTYAFDLLSKMVRYLLALRYGELMVETIGIVPFSGDDYHRQLLIILYHLFGASMLYSLFLLVVVRSFEAAYLEWEEWSKWPTDERPDGGCHTMNQRLASQATYRQAIQMNDLVLSDSMTAKYVLEFWGYTAADLAYEHFWKNVILFVFVVIMGGISYTFGLALYKLLAPCLLLVGCCVAASYYWLRWLRRRTATSGNSVGAFGLKTIDIVSFTTGSILYWFLYMFARVALSDKFLHTNLQVPLYDRFVGPLVEALGGPADMPPYLYIFVQAFWVVVLVGSCTLILRDLVCLLALPPNVSPEDFKGALHAVMDQKDYARKKEHGSSTWTPSCGRLAIGMASSGGSSTTPPLTPSSSSSDARIGTTFTVGPSRK